MIKVDSFALEDGIQKLNQIQKQMDRIGNDLHSVTHDLDWNHNVFKKEIMSTWIQIKAIDRQEQAILRMRRGLQQASEQYVHVEQAVRSDSPIQSRKSEEAIKVPTPFEIINLPKVIDSFSPDWKKKIPLSWISGWFPVALLIFLPSPCPPYLLEDAIRRTGELLKKID